MKITRRDVLKALGVSSVAANVLGQQLTAMAASGAGVLRGGGGNARPEVAGGRQEVPEIYRSVSAWWKERGEDQARKEAHYVSHFDVDILSRHLPLQAKVALQRQRNFERQKEERWRVMGKRIEENGLIKWWP